MHLRPITTAEHAVYDELARRHGTLFNRLDWLSLFGEKMQALGLFDDGGTMIGGLSLYQERRYGLKIFRRAPFTPTCGPFLEVKATNPVAILEARRKALECMVKYLEQQRYGIVMLPLAQDINDALPFFWRGYKVIPNYTYILDLTISMDQILKNMSPIRRNDISKATRDGLMVRSTSDMDVVRELVLATFGRQHKKVDRDGLDAILCRYANPSSSFAFTTYSQDRPIAACFVIHDGKTAYYLLGGYDAEYRHHGAGPLAVIEAIKHAKEIGLKSFDFEGSVIPNIESYFRGFGGTLTPYLTVNKAWLPIEIVIKLIMRNRY